jgi:hypothetical protein
MALVRIVITASFLKSVAIRGDDGERAGDDHRDRRRLGRDDHQHQPGDPLHTCAIYIGSTSIAPATKEGEPKCN